MCKMDIIAGIVEALKVGNLKYSRSNVRPGETMGVGVENTTVFKVSAIIIDGKEMFIWMFPNNTRTIYGGDLTDLFISMVENNLDPKIDRDWRGRKQMISHKWVSDRQTVNGDIHFSDYGYLSFEERNKLLEQLKGGN